MNNTKNDIEPATQLSDEDDEFSLPEIAVDEFPTGTADTGRSVVARFSKFAPSAPGVYRMIDAKGDVLYVGKAKNIKKRIISYSRPVASDERIARMIAATASMEFVSTKTETEALLLEANLIKRLRPRFNVLLRDDKSFPYILITSDHWAPQILKHRGARTRLGRYYGPFASAGSVNRTINALQRAFLLRSCSDNFFEARERPCLLHQIKRCSAPCTGEIDFSGYTELVREANEFLSGRSQAVQQELAASMDNASVKLDFEHAAIYRDRLSALSSILAHQGINPRTVEEADVFAAHQTSGYTCIQVFFFRMGQNWGNRAYFPRADRALDAGEILSAFIAQFYDDKPPPRLVLVSHDFEERELLGRALSAKSERKIEVSIPQRGERKELLMHAVANAREALARKLADTSSQQKLLEMMTETFSLPRVPRRIEVYDNSHIAGTNAVGCMIVYGGEGFRKNQYRKFNIRSEDITPGDDYGMMREVLLRRFKKLVTQTPRNSEVDQSGETNEGNHLDEEQSWPDLLLIDGGQGQLTAATTTLAELSITDIPIIAVAKGPDREAGRETFFVPGRNAFKLPPRDALVYFIERLRDEAHRFAVGSHRARRKKGVRESGLQEIPGIGPIRKRALLRHFGTMKAIECASVTDLAQVPGINAENARKIYEFFHEQIDQ
jgi:excinuclease ABC subunit C